MYVTERDGRINSANVNQPPGFGTVQPGVATRERVGLIQVQDELPIRIFPANTLLKQRLRCLSNGFAGNEL